MLFWYYLTLKKDVTLHLNLFESPTQFSTTTTTTMKSTDNGQILIRKAHLSLRLRWAKTHSQHSIFLTPTFMYILKWNDQNNYNYLLNFDPICIFALWIRARLTISYRLQYLLITFCYLYKSPISVTRVGIRLTKYQVDINQTWFWWKIHAVSSHLNQIVV